MGKVGENISLVGRICSVADVFDSLLDRRVYKDPWEGQRVKEYFEKMSGTQFDPQIASILLENFDMFIDTWKSMQKLKREE